jgi:hypothetical protein
MNDDRAVELGDKRLSYTYDELGTVVLELKAGVLSFEWVAGPFAGEAGEGFSYCARRVGDERFFLSWHEPEARGFVALYLDLDRQFACSAVLAGYATTEEQTLFESARINFVEPL